MSCLNTNIFPFETKWNCKGYYEMLEISKSWLGGGRLLDVGCGRGESTIFLDAIGFELSKFDTWKHIDATFLIANGVSLPFNDSVFDGILMNNVLEHIPDKKTVFSELKRVTKPDSNYVFILPTTKWKIYKFIDLPKNFIRILRGYEPVDWWVHAPEVHGFNWFSEYNEFKNWEQFLSKYFRIEKKIYARNGLQVLFKCLNK